MPRSTFAGMPPNPAAAAAPPRGSAPGACPGRLSARLAAGLLAMLAGCGEPPEPLAAPARPGALPGADIQRGRERIAEYGCAGCHTIPGIRGAGARVGPPLRNLAGRAYLAGVLANTPDNLVRWLRNPPAVSPRTAMPDLGLSESDARDIAAYLLSSH